MRHKSSTSHSAVIQGIPFWLQHQVHPPTMATMYLKDFLHIFYHFSCMLLKLLILLQLMHSGLECNPGIGMIFRAF
jgi:hypothetical protein